MTAATVVQGPGRLSDFATSDTTKPTESLSVRLPVASDATTYDAPSLFAVTTPVPSTVTTLALRDVNCRMPGVAIGVPSAVRTTTVSGAVPPVFMAKVAEPFGARTVSDVGAFGSVVVAVDEPHAAQRIRARPPESRRMRIRCAVAGRSARVRACSS